VRYKAVLFLRSFAVDAPHLYVNDKERKEDIQSAKDLDERTLQAWIGHPHLRPISNAGGPEAKFRKYMQEICAVLGIPVPIEHERKFLVKKVDRKVLESHTHVHVAQIEQTYLTRKGEGIERVRRRKQFDKWVYYHTIKTKLPTEGDNVEIERIITEGEAAELLWRRDPALKSIVKERVCFVYCNQYLELDTFLSHPSDGYDILEYEATKESGDMLLLPEFIESADEVTNNREFSNFAIARRNTLLP
jgi:CYTH domain-containing protein